MMNRVIVDELWSLAARQRKAKDAADADRHCLLVLKRHAHLNQLYFMIELGCELPDLVELLLWMSRNHNPRRKRLRSQVKPGEFTFARHEIRIDAP